MTYPDSVHFLFALGNELKTGAKWNLDRMRTLLRALGNPQRRVPFVHVAGTNGKGSTSVMIAAALQAAGRRTGLFTSPHLVSPTERIQVNGEALSAERFGEAFEVVHGAAERLEATNEIDAHPSYFETVTAMALLVFAGLGGERACDIAVVEVGLGGRLDATNLIRPEVSVITPISFDHEAFLGNTTERIATEKAGIIKRGVPVVSAPQPADAERVIRQRAADEGSAYHSVAELAVEQAEFTARGCRFELDGRRYECHLAGRHQLQNALTAIATCRLLKLPFEATARGIAGAVWPGRLEYLRERPDFVLDGAHNPAGAKALADYIREFCHGRPVWLVYGTMRDKAIDEVVSNLFPLADRVIVTAPNFPRALRPEAIVELSNVTGITVAPMVSEALLIADTAPRDAIVFFTGSLFLVGEVRGLLA